MEVRKILLADDDVEDRYIIEDAMKMLDFGDMLWFADNGEHALEILEKNYSASLTPCLIVLDLNMPKINGTETLSRLKKDQRFQHIPVIIYSTSINPIEKESCLVLGAHAYITKPISFQESLETAKTFLRFCPSEKVT
jgi:CheY-like chemotaxis protein